jgi:predicted PurR-regulated permease PerM
VTVPLLVALVLSTLFVPSARWLARRGVPDTFAALIVVAGGALISLAAIAFVVSLFVQQATQLTNTFDAVRSQSSAGFTMALYTYPTIR